MTAATIDAPSSEVAAPLEFVWLEITGKCQFHCTHCFARSGPQGSHGSMTADDWKRVLDQVAATGVRLVQFIGGEPTLHPALPALVEYALTLGLRAEVFSNLGHVTDELWEVFRRPGVSLATSYYSGNPDEHTMITQRPASYEQTRRNIARAVQYQIPIRVGIIKVLDEQDIEGARADLLALGVPEQAIGFDNVRALGRAAGIAPRHTPLGGCDAGELCGGCGDGKLAVMPDGSVTPCVMARDLELGTVTTHSITEIAELLPHARQRLIALGMPERQRTGCRPGGSGENCYPENEAFGAGCRPGGGGTNCYPENEAVRRA